MTSNTLGILSDPVLVFWDSKGPHLSGPRTCPDPHDYETHRQWELMHPRSARLIMEPFRLKIFLRGQPPVISDFVKGAVPLFTRDAAFSQLLRPAEERSSKHTQLLIDFAGESERYSAIQLRLLWDKPFARDVVKMVRLSFGFQVVQTTLIHRRYDVVSRHCGMGADASPFRFLNRSFSSKAVATQRPCLA